MTTKGTRMTGAQWMRLIGRIGLVGWVGMTLMASTALSAEPCDSWDGIRDFVAPDGRSSHEFGYAVAHEGPYALIGAPDDDDLGQRAGAAYVFDLTTGDLLIKLLAPDGEAEDRFGIAVDVNLPYGVITAQGDDNSAGSAYVFDVTTGEFLHKLVASDRYRHDLFGNSVAMQGDLVVVGSPYDDGLGNGSGSAYVFDIGSGRQLAKLVPSGGVPNESIGTDVDIHGDRIVVGGFGYNNDWTGAAYVFDLKTGAQLHRFISDSDHDWFGFNVAVDDRFAAVGAPIGGGYGRVDVFDIETGAKIYQLRPSDQQQSDSFGNCVEIDGGMLLASAPERDDNWGAAYAFDLETGRELHRFQSWNEPSGALFGYGMSFGEGRALIGARWEDRQHETDGAAYLFEAQCPAFSLEVSPLPLVAGQPASFAIRNGFPHSLVFLAYSTDGWGSTYLHLFNTSLDLSAPRQAGRARVVRADGSTEWELEVPDDKAGLDVWFQAIQAGATTGVVQTTIVP